MDPKNQHNFYSSLLLMLRIPANHKSVHLPISSPILFIPVRSSTLTQVVGVLTNCQSPPLPWAENIKTHLLNFKPSGAAFLICNIHQWILMSWPEGILRKRIKPHNCLDWQNEDFFMIIMINVPKPKFRKFGEF